MGDEVMITLPPGYKFSPSDEELIEYYLKPKVYGQVLPCNIIKEKEIYGPNANPWYVFDPSSTSWIVSSSGKFEKIAYVFTRLTKKKAPVLSSSCPATNKKKSLGREHYNKKAGCGTWHGETGRKEIMDRNGEKIIGIKRMLVFEINDVSSLGYGVDLDKVGYWKMHEFCLCGYEDHVLCQITWDTSKKAKVVSLCSKTVSRSCISSKPKGQMKIASPFGNTTDDSEQVGMNDQRLSLEKSSEIRDFGLVDDDQRCLEEINGMNTDYNLQVSTSCPNNSVCSDGLENQGNMNEGLVEYDKGGKHIVEEQGYDQGLLVDERLQGTEEALLSPFNLGFELDDNLVLDMDDLFEDSSDEDFEELYKDLSDKDMEVFNNQLEEFTAPLSTFYDTNDEQQAMQNYSSQVLGKRKSTEAEHASKSPYVFYGAIYNEDDDVDYDTTMSSVSFKNVANNSFGYNMGWCKEEHFNASDGDGLLNLTEFNNFLHPADSGSPTLLQWWCNEEIRDTDKDGKLNFKEFFHGLDLVRNYEEEGHNSSHELDDSIDAPARKVFAELDKDSDGYLSGTELLPVIGKRHPTEHYYVKQQADDVIQQADADKDGRLTLSEMIDSPYVFYNAIFNEDEEDDYEYHDEFR